MKIRMVTLSVLLAFATISLAEGAAKIRVTVAPIPERPSVTPKFDAKTAKEDAKAYKDRMDGAKDLTKVLQKRGFEVVTEGEDLTLEVVFRGWGTSSEVMTVHTYHNALLNSTDVSVHGQRLRKIACGIYENGELIDVLSSDISIGGSAMLVGPGGPISFGGAANNFAERFETWLVDHQTAK